MKLQLKWGYLNLTEVLNFNIERGGAEQFSWPQASYYIMIEYFGIQNKNVKIFARTLSRQTSLNILYPSRFK